MNISIGLRAKVGLGVLSGVLAWQADAALVDPGFDVGRSTFTPPNYTTSVSGSGHGGEASADGWSLWNNANTTTACELLHSTDPVGSGKMVHLTTGGLNCGLYQVFPEVASTTASVDVYVLRGKVTLYLYRNGAVMLSSTNSTTTNRWETLSLPVTAGVPNEFVLYSGATAGAEFYADRAAVPGATPLSLLVCSLSEPGFTNGSFRFTLRAPVGSNVVVQVSKDLTNWSEAWSTVMPAEGSVPVLRPRGKNEIGVFYRAVVP